MDLLHGRIFLLFRLIVKIGDEVGAMVLGYHVDDALRQLIFFGEFDTVLDMGRDDQGTHTRG